MMSRNPASAVPRRPTVQPLERRRFLASSISGIVFNDANADGVQQSGEAGLAGQQVFIDTNFDGQFEAGEPATSTDSAGAYSFAGLSAGVYRVSLVVPAGQRQTLPAQGFYDIAANGADAHASTNFALTSTAIVRGTVFNDTNANGIKDLTEQGLAGIVVFIDKNKNGKLDAGEKSRLTDGLGNYRFRGLTPGKYVFRILPPKGATLTTPGSIQLILKSGQSRSNRNFGLMT